MLILEKEGKYLVKRDREIERGRQSEGEREAYRKRERGRQAEKKREGQMRMIVVCEP